MKRFTVNMLTIVIVIAIGCMFLFANPSGHGDGGTLGQMSNNSAKHGYYTPMDTNIDLSNVTIDESVNDALNQAQENDPRTEEQKELGEMLWNQIYADGHLDDSERELWTAYCNEVAPNRL